MIERLRIAAFPVLAAIAALLLGLEPTALGAGRLIPLDWLAPALVALVAIILVATRGGRRPRAVRLVLYVLLAVLPPGLFAVLAGTALQQESLVTLAVLLGSAALMLGWSSGRKPILRWGVPLLYLALFLPLQLATQRMEFAQTRADTPHVGVMSALPLFRQHGAGEGLLDVGGRAPLLLALGGWIEPVDVLDADTLKRFDTLLLAQPRLLRPEELVALDAWVRGGKRVVILADPLLQWPDRRPLGDPRRAPLTSLLDPLMTHWGLVLEPARLDAAAPVARHGLAGGSVIQLAGASRFTLAKNAPCALEEGGLIARCRIGKGSALLVADADWINDSLWTRTPARPQDGWAWTTDAVPVLDRMLLGESGPFAPRWPWIKSQAAMISALRWCFALILLLGVLLALKGPMPISAHDPPSRKRGGRGSRASPSPDSGL